MNIVQGTQRPALLRPDRGIISVIEGGMPDASTIAGQERFALTSISESDQLTALTPHNYQAALGLLGSAAKALEMLYDRRDQLEASLENISTRAESAVLEAQAKVLDWQAVTSRLKSEMKDLETRLSVLQQRAETAEAQAEADRTRADAAERRAAYASDLLRGLHSKIMMAFGRGSGAHRALLVEMDQISSS